MNDTPYRSVQHKIQYYVQYKILILIIPVLEYIQYNNLIGFLKKILFDMAGQEN